MGVEYGYFIEWFCLVLVCYYYDFFQISSSFCYFQLKNGFVVCIYNYVWNLV